MWWAAVAAADCLQSAFPQERSEFPALLHCLGLTGEAVEVGVQAGVHAAAFLEVWSGQRLRLVDVWDNFVPGSGFYVDIANTQSRAARRAHREMCMERLAAPLQSGRAVLVPEESAKAAAGVPDGALDFVYLDARHDFAGVVEDIRAWWPKVRLGGVFAGHDYSDGEFPEGDFFWISALRQALPRVQPYVTNETSRYPSFFVIKSEGSTPVVEDPESRARELYLKSSEYYTEWRKNPEEFEPLCLDRCGRVCDARVRGFVPTREVASTLRPFVCAAAGCATELVVDKARYHSVCTERCAETCRQRAMLFPSLAQVAFV